MLKHRQYIYFYIFWRAILNETSRAKYDGLLPRISQVRPKSEIYTPKRDAEHPLPPCNFPANVWKNKPDSTPDPGDGGKLAYILLDLCESIIPQFNKVHLQFLQLMGQTYIQCCFSYVRKWFQLKNIKFDSLIWFPGLLFNEFVKTSKTALIFGTGYLSKCLFKV